MVFIFTFILGVCLLPFFPIGTIAGVIFIFGTFAVGKEEFEESSQKKSNKKREKVLDEKFSAYVTVLNNNPLNFFINNFQTFS